MSADLVGYAAPATLIILCSFLLYHIIVHPLLISPLAKIPNAHWTSPFVPWWILWKRYRQEELTAALKAHQSLGLIVRLGPKDLGVSCYEDGIRTIYGGGFDKPTYFNFFNCYESGPCQRATISQKRLTTVTGDPTLSAVLQEKIIRSTDGESPWSTPNLRFSALHN